MPVSQRWFISFVTHELISITCFNMLKLKQKKPVLITQLLKTKNFKMIASLSFINTKTRFNVRTGNVPLLFVVFCSIKSDDGHQIGRGL